MLHSYTHWMFLILKILDATIARLVLYNCITSYLVLIIIDAFLQFYLLQLDVLIVFIIMPMTDLPILILALISIFGLFVETMLIPLNFMDTFILFYVRIDVNREGQL